MEHFQYEPSWQHTYESFAERQLRRIAEAKRDRAAIEGSVTEPNEGRFVDVYDQVLGG